MQSFIQHLLYDILMKRTLDKVLKLFRKLHWDDPEVCRPGNWDHVTDGPQVYSYILQSFTDVWELRFGNIPFLAALVYDLQRYHIDFGIAVVDQVLEDVRIGMEVSHNQYGQRVQRFTRCRRTYSSSTKGVSLPHDISANCTCTVLSAGRSYSMFYGL